MRNKISLFPKRLIYSFNSSLTCNAEVMLTNANKRRIQGSGKIASLLIDMTGYLISRPIIQNTQRGFFLSEMTEQTDFDCDFKDDMTGTKQQLTELWSVVPGAANIASH